MSKKMIHKGQFHAFAGLCCGPGNEDNPFYQQWEDVFDAFYGTGESQTLDKALDADLSQWDIPDAWIMWSMARAHVIDSFVLRQFASDCIEHAGALIMVGEEDLVAEAVECARSYAVGNCSHEMLMETLEHVESVQHGSPSIEEHRKHFLNIMAHTLRPHPDAGAVQCAMNIPRCLDSIGENGDAEGTWQLAALRKRCEEAGFFEEDYEA